MSGLMDILTTMSNSTSEIVGAPIFLGMFALIFFLGLVAVAGLKADGKALIITLGATMVIGLFPTWLVQEIAIFGGFILLIAIMKLVGKW